MAPYEVFFFHLRVIFQRGQHVDDEWNPAEEFKQLCRTRWETCGGTHTLGSWRRYWEQAVQEVAAAVASPVEPAVVPGTSPAEAIASLTDTDLNKLKNAIDEESPSWRFLKLATVACQSVTLPHSGLARAALFSLRLRELHDAEDEDTMHDGRWYTMQESPGQRLESLGTPPEVE